MTPSRIYRELCVLLEHEHSAPPSPETALSPGACFASAPVPAARSCRTEPWAINRASRFLALSRSRRRAVRLGLPLEDIANELCRHRTLRWLALPVRRSLTIPESVDNSILRRYSIMRFSSTRRSGKKPLWRCGGRVSSQEMIWSGEFSISEAAFAECIQHVVAALRDQSRRGDRNEGCQAAQNDRHPCLPSLLEASNVLPLRSARLRRARKSFRQVRRRHRGLHRPRPHRQRCISNGSNWASATRSPA